nr:hypothetical protein [uncultured Draconibacterium sp.]
MTNSLRGIAVVCTPTNPDLSYVHMLTQLASIGVNHCLIKDSKGVTVEV